MKNTYDPNEDVELAGVGVMTLKTAYHCVLASPGAFMPTIFRRSGNGDTDLGRHHLEEIAATDGFEADEETARQVAYMLRNVKK